MVRRWALLPFALTLLFARVTRADTVAAEAAKGACSTSGVVGLSDQLVKVQMCLSPGVFVAFAPHPNVTLTSTNVKPFLLSSARDALWKAAGSLDVKINSAFRTLADQYVLYHSGACGLAAKPGESNHETGKALDLENWSAAISAMTAAGCAHTYPSTDPVHFDCPGIDDRADSIRAFQRLWNVNNPTDKLVEDGAYGTETASRLAKSPAGGFPDPADCKPKVPDWAAEFVDQSFPLAASGGVVTLTEGAEVTGWIDLKNVGANAWDDKTFLATTMPRDRASSFAAPTWPSNHRVAGAGAVAPGATHRFSFTLHAPDRPGDYDERLGVVEEGVAWFSDPGQGGPADDLLEIKIKVVAVADAGTDGGADAARVDASSDAGDAEEDVGSAAGCGCRATRGASASGPFGFVALAAIVAAVCRRRRAPPWQSPL